MNPFRPPSSASWASGSTGGEIRCGNADLLRTKAAAVGRHRVCWKPMLVMPVEVVGVGIVWRLLPRMPRPWSISAIHVEYR
ncbi:hypothetical protein BVC93_20855 [Mycobacterium sp. MS1601]|uniref:hypothetical protein n=1 Tax=Mycobacterium sp. MS1601 TaxID=1936029 RepID=UPI0009792320|nr:hypothetical protein [Mycobacterium sp. MS1601]AQA04466.1 hypothetical protein BVC93_20855 [Mycobacterium sp. MS1601]